jgi:hypothetical protein
MLATTAGYTEEAAAVTQAEYEAGYAAAMTAEQEQGTRVVARFDREAEALGIQFSQMQETQTGRPRVQIEHVLAGTAASRVRGLRPGLLLIRINGEQFDAGEWDHVVSQLRYRPLVLEFSNTFANVAATTATVATAAPVPAPAPAVVSAAAAAADGVGTAGNGGAAQTAASLIQARLADERHGIKHQDLELRQELRGIEEEMLQLSARTAGREGSASVTEAAMGGSPVGSWSMIGGADREEAAMRIPPELSQRDEFFTAHEYLVGKVHSFMQQLSTLDVAAVPVVPALAAVGDGGDTGFLGDGNGGGAEDGGGAGAGGLDWAIGSIGADIERMTELMAGQPMLLPHLQRLRELFAPR